MSKANLLSITQNVLPPEVPTSFTSDLGVAVPIMYNLNILGGDNINTTGSSDTITIDLNSSVTGLTDLSTDALTVTTGTPNSVLIYGAAGAVSDTTAMENGELVIGATGSAPQAASLTSSDGSISFSPGANSLDLVVVSSNVIKFLPDQGTSPVNPNASDEVTLAGGTNITTDGSTATVTINLDDAISLATSVTSPLYTTSAADMAITAAANQDIILTLGDSAGANGVLFHDSVNNPLAVLNSDGELGIGTISPNAKLEVAGDAYIHDNSFLGTNGSTGGTSAQSPYLNGHVYVVPLSGGDISYLQARRNPDSGNAGFRIRTTNSGSINDSMEILPGGNVGIGTTSPNSTLSVSGGPISQDDFADGDKFWLMGATTAPKIAHGSGWNFGFFAGTTTQTSVGRFNWYTVNASNTFTFRMTLINEGKLGINEGTPASTLSVDGGVAVGSTYAGSNAAATDNLIVEGQVGVNTPTPGADLDVEGTIWCGVTTSNTTQLRLQSERSWDFVANGSGAATEQWLKPITNGKSFVIKTADGLSTNALFFCTNTVASNQIRLVPDGGKVGLGTDSIGTETNLCKIKSTSAGAETNPLILTNESNTVGTTVGLRFAADVTPTPKASIMFESTASDGRGTIHFCLENGANGVYVTKANAKMSITREGDVGIGTASPAVLLHVQDTALSSPLISTNSKIVAEHNGQCDISMIAGSTSTSSLKFDVATATEGELKYNHSTDELTWSTNAALAWTIDASQNMTFEADLYVKGDAGIGTTSPNAKLEVFDAVLTDALIRGTDRSFLTVFGENNSRGTEVAGVIVKSQLSREAGFYIQDELANEIWHIGHRYNGGSDQPDLQITYNAASTAMSIDSSQHIKGPMFQAGPEMYRGASGTTTYAVLRTSTVFGGVIGNSFIPANDVIIEGLTIFRRDNNIGDITLGYRKGATGAYTDYVTLDMALSPPGDFTQIVQTIYVLPSEISLANTEELEWAAKTVSGTAPSINVWMLIRESP